MSRHNFHPFFFFVLYYYNMTVHYCTGHTFGDIISELLKEEQEEKGEAQSKKFV
jgi:hypothetical protein